MISSGKQLWSEFIFATVIRRTRVGRVVFATLFLLCMGLCVTLTRIDGMAPWAVATILLALLFGYAAMTLKNKHRMASWIALHPEEILWVHPSDVNGLVADLTIDQVRTLTFHLRNGYRLEVEIAPSQRSEFSEWMKTAGTQVVWGPWPNE